MNTLRVEKHEDGIAVIHLDDREDRVNTLSTTMMSEMEEALGTLESDATIQGLVIISDKKDNFIVGADLKEFSKIMHPGMVKPVVHRVHALFNRIEALPFPVLAAIHGPCLGGGLELALACRFRIATDHPKTSLGLPEVKLGILPAGGGTQRMTRLLGVGKALPLMMQGRTLNAAQAKSMGLIDKVVYPHNLLHTAKQCLLHFGKRFPLKTRHSRLMSLDWVLEHMPPVRQLFFNRVRQATEKQTQGNYPAPLRVIECVETGLSRGMEAGLEAEANTFDDLVLTPESQALRQLFFDTTALKKNPLADRAKPVEKVAVLGSGLMGSGIAAVTAQAGLSVVLKDVAWSNLGAGLKSIWSHFDQRVRRQRRNHVERDKAYSRIIPTLDSARLAKADLVIEAVFEDLALKQQVVREVEAHVGPECIFASNTSAIPIHRIAEASKRPELVIGMHYFSPVPRMPLLEVVITPQTPDWVTATAVSVGQQQGKTVMVVKDGPGFYTSRILSAMVYEAVTLLHERADIRQMDNAMRQFGFPVGPFRLLDEVGIDVAAHVSRELQSLFATRHFLPMTGIEKLLEEGYRGRKSGQGFYHYTPHWWEGRLRPFGIKFPRPVNEAVYAHFGGRPRQVMDTLEIQERLALMMVNEAVLCLQEGIIASPRDGDVGAVLGLGFPPFLGGPFRYLQRLGPEAITKFERLTDKVGPRFQPASLLVEMATHGDIYTQHEPTSSI